MGDKRRSLTQILNNHGIFFLIRFSDYLKVLAGATFPKVNFLKRLSHSEACTTEKELTSQVCSYQSID